MDASHLLRAASVGVDLYMAHVGVNTLHVAAAVECVCVCVCVSACARACLYVLLAAYLYYSSVHTRSAPRSSVTAFVVQDIIRVILLPLCIAVMCVTRRRLTGDTPNRIILWFFRVLVIVGMLEVIEVGSPTLFVCLPSPSTSFASFPTSPTVLSFVQHPLRVFYIPVLLSHFNVTCSATPR